MMRRSVFVIVCAAMLSVGSSASAKLPPFSFVAEPTAVRAGEPITLTMRCFEDTEHTRPWPSCFGVRDTMAWVHPLDDEGSLTSDDWIAVRGHATDSGATQGRLVLAEPGRYRVTPLWKTWRGDGLTRTWRPGPRDAGFPDPIILQVTGDQSVAPLGIAMGGGAAVVAVLATIAIRRAARTPRSTRAGGSAAIH
jgi:hypothetical protein